MARRSRAEHPFPRLPFFAVRLLQFIEAIIVVGVLGFFEWGLYAEDYGVPWEFTLLDAAAALSIINSVISAGVTCCLSITPITTAVIDGLLALFWTICFGMFAKAMGKTTTQGCSNDNWGDANGVRICQLFKVLMAFAFLTMFTFWCTFVWAVVLEKKRRSHAYAPAYNPGNLHEQKTSYGQLRDSTMSFPLEPVEPVEHEHAQYRDSVGPFRDSYRDSTDLGEFSSVHAANQQETGYPTQQQGYTSPTRSTHPGTTFPPPAADPYAVQPLQHRDADSDISRLSSHRSYETYQPTPPVPQHEFGGVGVERVDTLQTTSSRYTDVSDATVMPNSPPMGVTPYSHGAGEYDDLRSSNPYLTESVAGSQRRSAYGQGAGAYRD